MALKIEGIEMTGIMLDRNLLMQIDLMEMTIIQDHQLIEEGKSKIWELTNVI